MCPTNKVLAFDGDAFDANAQVSYLDQARDTISKALCSLMDDGPMDLAQAKEIAGARLYNNPNRKCKLNFEPYEVHWKSSRNI